MPKTKTKAKAERLPTPPPKGPRLYRSHVALLDGRHWGSITAEPAMVDCGIGRHIRITNQGPDVVHLSSVESGPSEKALKPPDGHRRGGGSHTTRARTFLRSEGKSSVSVLEYFDE